MGLFWSESKETVSNAELKTLIEGIPTESEMPNIIKSNAGGTVFKPKSVKIGNSTTESIITLSNGKTYKLLCAPSAGSGFRIAPGTMGGSGNVSINGKALEYTYSAPIFLPLNQIVEVKNNSGSAYIYGEGALYEVE